MHRRLGRPQNSLVENLKKNLLPIPEMKHQLLKLKLICTFFRQTTVTTEFIEYYTPTNALIVYRILV